MILTATRSLKNLTAVADARKALESSRAEDAAWTGFKEQPPYSILMIDELLNERDAIKANLTSSESSLANYERLLASLMARNQSRRGSRQRQIARRPERATTPPARPPSGGWRRPAPSPACWPPAPA